MNKKILAILSIIFIITLASLGGCSGPSPKITATVAPVVPTAENTTTPTPTPTPTLAPSPGVSHPRVTSSDGTITVRGSKNETTSSILLGVGVYTVTWSGSGTYLNLSLTDYQGNGAPDASKGRTGGKRLLAADDIVVYSGNFTLKAASDSDWTVKIEKLYASSADSLPVTVSGSEEDGAITPPFHASEGKIKVSFAFSMTAWGTGSVDIYDVSTGRSFYTRPLSENTQVGQFMADVPATSIYIAQVNFPKDSKYGSITISQE